MTFQLDRIDAVPLAADNFSVEYRAWVAVLVDSLNSVINTVENALNNLAAPQFTTAEIAALVSDAPNGALFYDTTLNQLQAKVNGVLVVLA